MVKMTQMVPMISGVGASAEVGKRMKEFGCTKILLVHGKEIEGLGLAEKIAGYLLAEGLEVVDFNKVVSDPSDKYIDENVQFVRDSGVDGAVAVGGGSAMDTAKALLGLATREGTSIRDHMFHRTSAQWLNNNGYHLICIPTTSGTGSEASEAAVVTDTAMQFKSSFKYPADLAILDPEMTVSMPKHLTAETAMDAMAHATESYVHAAASPKNFALNGWAIKTITKYLPIVTENPDDLEARGKLQAAAAFAAMGFNDAGLNMGHGIAHNLGVVYHIPHGVGCALTVPEMIIHYASAVPERVREIGEYMGMSFEENEAPLSVANKIACKMRELMKLSGVRDFRTLGYTKEQIQDVAHHTFDVQTQVPFWMNNTPGVRMNEDYLRYILGQMYDNYTM